MDTMLQVHLFAFSGLLLEQSGRQLDGCCRGSSSSSNSSSSSPGRGGCGVAWCGLRRGGCGLLAAIFVHAAACLAGLWADPVPLAVHYVIAVAMAAAVSWMTCS
ncbi:hypothetical protein CHLRE_06g300326v5 [Chlamydomonas reinhardtii]|uniref:Uncharacterized protein n=1 Tax=Chlamydomonas reinhardtii TaxID=3055 RepID=A8INT8_CHLRE|nr:uncharacterized protein CHLRE_06g300326v5 [Chlamydomonas reinhardtii]PNW82938.1 hypothetical protein CHLRE_06g300326v5 [Chlamydomonas reinhardtii]|eukprot:XP_001691282.1 predicted protein [Chlamydomonas reinhardtii]